MPSEVMKTEYESIRSHPEYLIKFPAFCQTFSPIISELHKSRQAIRILEVVRKGPYHNGPKLTTHATWHGNGPYEIITEGPQKFRIICILVGSIYEFALIEGSYDSRPSASVGCRSKPPKQRFVALCSSIEANSTPTRSRGIC